MKKNLPFTFYRQFGRHCNGRPSGQPKSDILRSPPAAGTTALGSVSEVGVGGGVSTGLNLLHT